MLFRSDRWFQTLGESSRAEIEAKVNLLELFGPALGRPHADTLKGSRFPNMKELRADVAGHTLRIAFAFDTTRAAILLLGGDKRGSSSRVFYRRLIARADSLFSEHLTTISTSKSKRGER